MNEIFILTDLEYYLGVEISRLDAIYYFIKSPRRRFSIISIWVSVIQYRLRCRAVLGSLMYSFQWTRPALGFAVTFLSKYLHKPGEKYLLAAKHVLCYFCRKEKSCFCGWYFVLADILLQREAKQRGDKLPDSERSPNCVREISSLPGCWLIKAQKQKQQEMMTLGVLCTLLFDVYAG